MTAERQLFSAYDRVSSTKATDRQSGLSDLRQLLLNKRNANRLNDKGFHKMYEVLFKCTLLDKAGYTKGGKGQKAFATRLSSCAAVLRMAVEAGVQVLKSKTVRALYNHILDSLPTAGVSLCEPLSLDYLRALAACLGQASHAEHLPHEDWIRITLFCCAHLRQQLGLPADDTDQEEPEAPRVGMGRVLLRDDSSMSWRSNSQATPRLSHESEELVACLRNLVAASNAPMLDDLDVICGTLLGFLRSQSTFSRAQQSSFASLNSILARITTNSLKWVAKISDAVVPLIARLWDTKAPGLKDEMLVTLIHCLPHIRARLKAAEEATEEATEERADAAAAEENQLRENIEKLLESLSSEYRQRPERDVLQPDDVSFQSSVEPTEVSSRPLGLKCMCLAESFQEFRMEQGWAILHTIAQLTSILDGSRSLEYTAKPRGHIRQPSGAEPPKKRRQAMYTQLAVLRRAVRTTKDTTSHRLLALHVIPFLSDLGGIDEEHYTGTVHDLYEACQDGDPIIASWAMISTASCAYLEPARNPERAAFWQQTWKLCERAMTTAATCRASCNLMRTILSRNILSYTDVSKSVDAMLRSVDLNGPAILADSSLGLLSLLIVNSFSVAQSSRRHPGHLLFQWFISKWRPVENLERVGGTFYTTTNRPHNVSTLDMVNFLLECASCEPIGVQSGRHVICGSLGQAYAHKAETWQLEKILLDAPDETIYREEAEFPTLSKAHYRFGDPDFELQILDFLSRQTALVHEKWRTIMTGQIQHVTESIVRNFLGFILLATIVGSKMIRAGQKRCTDLRTTLEVTLIADLLDYVNEEYCQHKQTNGILMVVSEFLPRASIIITPDSPVNTLPQATRALLTQLFEVLSKKERIQDTAEEANDDAMDIDDGFDNVKAAQPAGGEIVRETLKARCSEEGFRASTMALLALHDSSFSDADPAEKCDTFAKYLQDTQWRRFIMMRPVVVDFLTVAREHLTNEVCGELARHLAKILLEGYEIERCESSLGFCVDATNALAPRWLKSNKDENQLDQCSRAVYDHATRIGLLKKITSPDVQISIVRLLQHVMELDSDFDKNEKAPPLGLFLGALGLVDVRVAHSVARALPFLLSLHKTSLHNPLIQKVEEALPHTREWTEGLALRVYALSQLATNNSSFITRIVYRIFETAQVPDGARYAARALLDVAKASKLEDQRSLFKIFSANLIHSWSEHQELHEFPFHAFGYNSLKEMYADVPDQLLAYLITRNKEDVAEEVAGELDRDFEELLRESFPRVAAYAYIWDVIYPLKDGSDRSSETVEGRIRKHLGDDQYKDLLGNHYRTIVSNLLELMFEDESSDRLLAREPRYADAYHVMTEIKQQGCSQEKLVQPLQPNFKVKVLLLAVDHVCTRLGLEQRTLWNPAMLTFVIRTLFNSLHPVRGPLHACGVIRKIRLLVCLAGHVVQQGYLLEMIIHGLKAYVVDSTCAEDTVGVLKYLLINGKPHLQRQPAFAIGIFLSLLASLRDFMKSCKTAEHQDSQTHKTTISFAVDFHQWFAIQLGGFEFPDLPSRQREAFRAIVRSAVRVKESGNALKDSQESELLRILIQDDQSKDKLLDDTSRRLAFNLYCSHFERPRTSREDIFGTDEASVESAKILMRISKKFDVGNGFLLWTARVLGRSYASTGQLHTWMQEMEFDHPSDEEFPAQSHGTDAIPKVAILRRIRGLLLSNETAVVDQAERTLERTIFSEIEDPENTLSHRKVLLSEEIIALKWPNLPVDDEFEHSVESIDELPKAESTPVNVWIRDFAIVLCLMIQEPVLNPLPRLLMAVDGLAQELFPFIVHIVLGFDGGAPKGVRDPLSTVFEVVLAENTEATIPHCSILIDCILYLRSQPTLNEIKVLLKTGHVNKSSRDAWLDLDYLQAAQAAARCKKYRSALLFVEIYSNNDLRDAEVIPPSLLLEIFENIDDPDSYYGVEQPSDLASVLKKFEYERDGWKSLSLRGAHLESNIRLGERSDDQRLGVADSLNTLGMNGLAYSFIVDASVDSTADEASEKMFRSAWKLEQWDLPCPETSSTPASRIYRTLQTVNTSMDTKALSTHIDPTFLQIMKQVTAGSQTGEALGTGMRNLAMLTEMEEILLSSDYARMKEVEDKLQARTTWMHTGSYSDVEEIMAMRQAAFGSLAKQKHLQNATGTDLQAARLFEARALVASCKMARSHSVLQHSLSAATQLSKVVEPCQKAGIEISAVATLQAAKVLWDDGQSKESIGMLKRLGTSKDLQRQSMPVGRPKLLARLGSWISEARLEDPGKIMSEYLEKAIHELKGNDMGSDAGRVFHEFAAFCDQQLKNPGNIEDYERALKLREAKQAELQDLKDLMKQNPRNKAQYNTHHRRAAAWLELDDKEFNRLKNIREAFLEKSISNYLKCLAACDDYDGDAVRFSALWLANHENDQINNAAGSLQKVPSRKFVPLMNQLSSRLLATRDTFQILLMNLIIRICNDHPYHGNYHILALTRAGQKDTTSKLRQNAALSVSGTLKSTTKSYKVFSSIEISTGMYERLAHAKLENQRNDKRPVKVKDFFVKDGARAPRFEKDLPRLNLPPPTMNVAVRNDCNYTTLPTLVKFESEINLASGLSAPKICRCQTSDGKRHKMLVKGGNDDLRQDSIMEQVFEQVSVLLQKARVTRQRNLKVRTYKVVPLTATAGVIEFVQNTIPLTDYIQPAHNLYWPKDLKWNQCRKMIADAQQDSREARLKQYRTVCAHFHPVMQFFFMHKFNGPDEWYNARLAYTRSTAAISILGHVLGLGDRHGHNILLDQNTGEVVHIDLGVAFEQGRILPVPETVPFRLSRDIVAGMGITRTEGVFRRCCEFTLEVLRNEAYNITTILDVLRYDPLYSWSMSPVRIKRMQDNPYEASEVTKTSVDGVPKKNKDDDADADRALTVVAKKLSKTLSVGATVNELIQQAGDEKNLATLYAGWAAWA